MPKQYYNYLRIDWNLYFPLLKKTIGIIVLTKKRPNNPITKIININTKYYIYIIFAIIIYLGNIYILIYIYMKYQMTF